MGAVTEARPRTVYVQFKKGVCSVYDSGATSSYPGWKGYVTGFSYRTGEEAKFGTEFHIHMQDGSEKAVVQMLLKSGSFMQFAMALENIDLTKPITLYPWYKEKGDKKFGGVNVYQDGKQVEPKYSNKELNGMPEIVEEDDGTGKMVKNYRARILFLRNIVDTVVAPKVKEVVDLGAWKAEETPVGAAPSNGGGPSAAQVVDQGPPPITAGDEDDLPF
jgi:hypothetical protein